MAAPELTATQHKTRVRILAVSAAAVSVVLGYLAIAWNLSSDVKHSDAPFWQRLWSGAADPIKAGVDSLRGIGQAKTSDQEAKELSKQVFPQFKD